MTAMPVEWSAALFAASPDAVLVVGPDGRIKMASPAVERLFGYRPDELVDQAVEQLIPDELRPAHRHHRVGYATHPVQRAMGAGLAPRGRRRDGTTFPVDVSLAPVVVGGTKFVGAFIRDATVRRRNETLLRYVNEISQQLLAEPDASKSLALTASRARALAGAVASWVVVPQSRDTLHVAAADGEGAEHLVGAALSSSSISARVMGEGATTPVPDLAIDPAVIAEARPLGLGPGLYLPMLARDGAIGALVVARSAGDRDFDTGETRSLEVFAAAAAVVVSLGHARQELDRLQSISEHERIARDLHDTVIQRLFALGMSLQALQMVADGVVGERLQGAVETIDQVIREIRETIFELHRPDTGGPDIRQQLRDVSAEAAAQLGFEPRLAFRGPVEAAISDELVPHLLAVAREALSNVARHARASSVEVVLAAASGAITLSVADDGCGLPDGPAAGNGLANMKARANKLGGDMQVTQRLPEGTTVEWHVPTHATTVPGL